MPDDDPTGHDVVAWSERQAAALRRHAGRHPDAGVDWPRVIEAVEGAGRGLLREHAARTPGGG